jgi:hypothetical protein
MASQLGAVVIRFDTKIDCARVRVKKVSENGPLSRKRDSIVDGRTKFDRSAISRISY